jgi:hypothetical protein
MHANKALIQRDVYTARWRQRAAVVASGQVVTVQNPL